MKILQDRGFGVYHGGNNTEQPPILRFKPDALLPKTEQSITLLHQEKNNKELSEEQMAQRLINAIVQRKIKEGGAATELSAWQNTVITLASQKKISSVPLFFKHIKQHIRDHFSSKGNSLETKHIEEIYSTLQGFETSITHIVSFVLPDIEQSFQTKYGNDQKDMHHTLGINNELDARFGVDLVEIVYKKEARENEETKTIVDIRLIQTKSSPIKPEEQSKTEQEYYDLHRQLVALLLSEHEAGSIIDAYRNEEAKKTVLESFRIKNLDQCIHDIKKGNETEQQKAIASLEQWKTMCLSFLEQFILEYTGVDTIDHAVQAALTESGMTDAQLHTILKDQQLYTLCCLFAGLYIHPAYFSLTGNHELHTLRTIKKNQPYTAEQMQTLGIKDPTFIFPKQYTSVIYAGKQPPKSCRIDTTQKTGLYR